MMCSHHGGELFTAMKNPVGRTVRRDSTSICINRREGFRGLWRMTNHCGWPSSDVPDGAGVCAFAPARLASVE